MELYKKETKTINIANFHIGSEPETTQKWLKDGMVADLNDCSIWLVADLNI